MLQIVDAAVILTTDLTETADVITGATTGAITAACGSSCFSSSVADVETAGDVKADATTTACGSSSCFSSAVADAIMDANAYTERDGVNYSVLFPAFLSDSFPSLFLIIS